MNVFYNIKLESDVEDASVQSPQFSNEIEPSLSLCI